MMHCTSSAAADRVQLDGAPAERVPKQTLPKAASRCPRVGCIGVAKRLCNMGLSHRAQKSLLPKVCLICPWEGAHLSEIDLPMEMSKLSFWKWLPKSFLGEGVLD